MWLNVDASLGQGSWRYTNFNNTVLINEVGLAYSLQNFNSVWGEYKDFSDELASIMFIPIKNYVYIPPNTSSNKFYLNTTKYTSKNILVQPIDKKSLFQVIGQHYIQPKFNNFADYKGYTYIKAYLPYLGYVDVDVNECMGKYLLFFLSVDVQTGVATYMLGVSGKRIPYNVESPYIVDERFSDVRIFATYQTKIGIEIPVGKSNIGDIIRNNVLGAVKTAASVAAAIYTRTLPPPTTTQKTTKTYDIQGRGLYKGARMKQMVSGTEETKSTRTYSKSVDYSKPISEAVDGSIDTLNRFIPDGNTDRINDSLSLSIMSPYVKIIIYRPKMMNTSEQFNKLIGSPVGATHILANMKGYTEISSIHIEGQYFENMTSEEYDELESILLSSNGIILSDDGQPAYLNKFNLYNAREGVSYVDRILINTFYYPPGMTWDDFVYSEYNINSLFSIEGDSIIYDKGYPVYTYDGYEYVNAYTEIDATEFYS